MHPDFGSLLRITSNSATTVKLFSKDETFFDLFRQLAVHIGTASTLLKTIFDNPEGAQSAAIRIKRVETEGDQIVQTINQSLDSKFVTPLDREDIHLLAKRLDNVIDLVNAVARRVVMFRVTESRPGFVEMAGILERASEEILASISDITRRQKMMAHGRAIKVLEEEGDVRYAEAVGALFDHDMPAIEVLKWKEIFDALEEAIDECEDVSNALESIAVKNS